jgi:hypothetical protein
MKAVERSIAAKARQRPGLPEKDPTFYQEAIY